MENSGQEKEAVTDELCSDCPPVSYTTERTRCLPCPRRNAGLEELAELRAEYKAQLTRGIETAVQLGVAKYNLATLPDRARNAALEEAAKVCEGMERAYWEEYKRHKRADARSEALSDGAGECAAAIRALKS